MLKHRAPLADWAQSRPQRSAECRMSGARLETRHCPSPEWGSVGRRDTLEALRHELKGLWHGDTVWGVVVNRIDTATPSQEVQSGCGDGQLTHTHQ